MTFNLHVLGIKKIHDFMQKHTDSKEWLEAWLAEARKTEWRGPSDIRDRYTSASFIEDCIVIFNVKGNNYRMEVEVLFERQIVYIRRIGTHAEYDRWKK